LTASSRGATLIEEVPVKARAVVQTKIQGNFKIEPGTKSRVDLMASALGIDKGKVIDEAVALLAQHRSEEMRKYIDAVRASFDGTGGASPGELFTGKRRNPAYAGGPVKK
jgi:hypothetical protein